MRTALAVITVLCVAACGGSNQSAGTGASTPGGGFRQALKFSQCMRANGVPNFPDPGSGGAIQIPIGSALKPQSPAFQTAQKKCRKLLPGGGPGGPHKATAAQFAAALAFARCMRSHGLPHFPDPLSSTPAGSGPILSLRGMMFKPGPDLDPKSPGFQQAASHCGLKLPKPTST
jgi:hypothetical protein